MRTKLVETTACLTQEDIVPKREIGDLNILPFVKRSDSLEASLLIQKVAKENATHVHI